jgi:hypothetical protein
MKHVDFRKQRQELVKNVECHHEMGRQPWKIGSNIHGLVWRKDLPLYMVMKRQVGIEFQP